MNRYLLVTIAIIPIFSEVHAADLRQPVAQIANNEALSMVSWNGFYTGLSMGWARVAINGNTLQADGTSSARTVRESADQLTRVVGGSFHLGWQKQLSSLAVLGVEGDFSRLGGHSQYTDTVISGNIWAGQTSSVISYRTPWLATGRVKLGMTLSQVMVYATGGIAFSSEHETRAQYIGNQVTSLTELSFIESDRKLRTGFALGGGVEWRLVQSWSLRAEFLRSNFASTTFQFPNARGGVVPTGGYTSVLGRLADNQSHIDIARIGLSYHF